MREFVVGLSVLLCFSLYANAELPSSQPNVLMICIDDLNDWVGFLEAILKLSHQRWIH